MSCLMSTNNTRMRNAGFAIFVLLATLSTTGQAQTEPEQVNFCDVVASPTNYDGKLLSVEAILQPGFHSLFLYSSVCPSKEGFDVTTQAILPDGWESLPNKTKHQARSVGQSTARWGFQKQRRARTGWTAVPLLDFKDSGCETRYII